MPRKRLLTLQIAGLIVGLIGGLSAATQLLADKLNHHELLGTPLFELAETPVYWPWQWLFWAQDYYEALPTPFDESAIALAGGGLAGVVWAVILKRKFAIKDGPTSHGSSRWARSEEIREIGLPQSATDARGLILGRSPDTDELLTHRGKEHAFVFAPTRSGKGVGLVVPTLLTWLGSTVVLDVKGENWDLTAGWRGQFSHVLYFDPTTRKSCTFNPLLEVRQGDPEVRDVRNIIDILANPDGETRDDFWNQSAKKFLVGAVLHVLYAGDDKSLAGVLAFLQNPEWTHEERLKRMLETKHLGDKTHPVVARAARATLNAPENTRGGILATAESYLGLFDDPVVADVTSGESDFRLRDLQYADNPVSLYLVIPPGDLARVRPLLRLMLVQLGARLTETLDPHADKHRLLMMLDEFPTLGKLEWFESALAYVAGYDIRCFLIAQDLNQIEKAYGQNNAILGNCHIRVAFAPNDEKTAKRLTGLLGKKTAVKETESLSGDRASLQLDRKSESKQEYARDLLTPGEVLQLPDDKELLFIAGEYPILADKVRYYEEPHFQRRCPGIDPDATDEWAHHLTPPALLPNTPYPDRPPGKSSPWLTRPTPTKTKSTTVVAESIEVVETTPEPEKPVVEELDEPLGEETSSPEEQPSEAADTAPRESDDSEVDGDESSAALDDIQPDEETTETDAAADDPIPNDLHDFLDL